MAGILHIVATPIGNLEDISFRALRILKEADLILCEDTRVTKKLLEHYGIKTALMSYHQHSRLEKENEIAGLLKSGKNLVLVSDAGTPGISDPGNRLISHLLGLKIPDLKIVPIPGPSALILAASISGFPMDKFLFLGFPPIKNKRRTFFQKAVESEYPAVFYESPYKILKSLGEIADHDRDREVIVCRELTKKFETVYRGPVKDVIEQVKKDPVKGEFTVIISKA